MEYHLRKDGLIKFRDMIYVRDSSELKKTVLRVFHVKVYSGHPRYQKTLITMKKFYYWLNLKKDMADFLARCLDCQQVKVKCKHSGGLL